MAVTTCAAIQGALSTAANTTPVDRPELAETQRLFYTGSYEAASALALTIRTAHPDDLDSYEVRSSALHFQIKRALRDAAGHDVPYKQCASCPDLLKEFLDETAKGQEIARARLKVNPNDNNAEFLLGKLDLNYVWLHLGTIGRKTGWNEYWEARRSLDEVLKRDPTFVRAKTARAWMEYIVATKTSIATRWLLGGGNKKRALGWVREAAAADADYYVHVEADFALWEMLVRERDFTNATVIARRLAKEFPDNKELATFLTAHP
jgi:hypothetical protein